jgi:hypothetical protein
MFRKPEKNWLISRKTTEVRMKTKTYQSLLWTTALICLGLIAISAGAKWLTLLIPAALLIWYGAGPVLRSGRN